jgi:type IX secretion system PorP/SprF family membrane protein
MKLTKTLFLLFALAASVKSGAQSQYQFTQFDMNPIFLNPAQTGAYEGTYRIGGIYRSQWNSFSNIYHPSTAFIDAPLLLIAKRHWLGLGVMFASDNAGSHNAGTTLTALSASFHYALDKKYKNVITLGLQFGSANRSISKEKKDGTAGSYQGLANGQAAEDAFWATINYAQGARFVDATAGLLFKSVIDKKNNLELGFTFGHINKGKYTLLAKPTGDKSKDNIPYYYALTADFDHKINNKLSINPKLLFHNQTAAYTTTIQALVGYKMTLKGSSDPITLKGGLGYRQNGNAANILLGADVRNIKVRVGYDVVTGAIAKSVKDVMEIALQYTGKIYKKPNVKGVMVCPKY